MTSFKKVSPLFVPLCGSGVTKLLALDFNCLSKGIVRAQRLITLSGAFYLKVIGSNADYAPETEGYSCISLVASNDRYCHIWY